MAVRAVATRCSAAKRRCSSGAQLAGPRPPAPDAHCPGRLPPRHGDRAPPAGASAIPAPARRRRPARPSTLSCRCTSCARCSSSRVAAVRIDSSVDRRLSLRIITSRNASCAACARCARRGCDRGAARARRSASAGCASSRCSSASALSCAACACARPSRARAQLGFHFARDRPRDAARRNCASSRRACMAPSCARSSPCSRCAAWICAWAHHAPVRSPAPCSRSAASAASSHLQRRRRPQSLSRLSCLSRWARSSTPACGSPPRRKRSQLRPSHSPVGVTSDSPRCSVAACAAPARANRRFARAPAWPAPLPGPARVPPACPFRHRRCRSLPFPGR